jgi:hypothetical protein
MQHYCSYNNILIRLPLSKYLLTSQHQQKPLNISKSHSLSMSKLLLSPK